MRFQSAVPLVVSALIHAAALIFLVASSKELEVGKNIPELVYPVRVRVVANGLAQVNPVPIASHGNGLPIKRLVPTPLHVFGGAEGRLEQSSKKYAESSERYFTPSELDSRPTVITVPDLEKITVGPMIEGHAVVRMFINEGGAVDRFEVEESTLPEVMIEYLRLQRDRLLFAPGSKNGINVKSVISYKIELVKEPIITTINPSAELTR